MQNKLREESTSRKILNSISVCVGTCLLLIMLGAYLPISHAVAAPQITPTTSTASGKSVRPRAPTDLKKVAIGASWMIGILQNNTLVSWGDNRYWQSTIPYRYKDILFKDVAASLYVAYALDVNGNLYSWSDANTYGEVNIPVAAQTGVDAIAAGGNFALALKSDGTVIAWGRNNKLQLEISSGLNNVTAIAAGGRHALALRADGTVVAWGDNQFGQARVPAGLSGVTAISAGEDHSMALLNTGRVVLWGRNTFGQLDAPRDRY